MCSVVAWRRLVVQRGGVARGGIGVGEPSFGELLFVVVGWRPDILPVIGHVLGGELWNRYLWFEGAAGWAPYVFGPLFEVVFPFGAVVGGGVGGFLGDGGVEASEAVVKRRRCCVVEVVVDDVVTQSSVPAVVVTACEVVVGVGTLS